MCHFASFSAHNSKQRIQEIFSQLKWCEFQWLLFKISWWLGSMGIAGYFRLYGIRKCVIRFVKAPSFIIGIDKALFLRVASLRYKMIHELHCCYIPTCFRMGQSRWNILKALPPYSLAYLKAVSSGLAGHLVEKSVVEYILNF